MSIIPHNQLFFNDEEVKAVTEVVRSGHWAGNECVAQLEKFAQVAGTKYAVSVGTGTGALRIALLTLGVQEGIKLRYRDTA